MVVLFVLRFLFAVGSAMVSIKGFTVIASTFCRGISLNPNRPISDSFLNASIGVDIVKSSVLPIRRKLVNFKSANDS